MTVTGKTLGENLSGKIDIDRSVIRTQDDPASVANGIQVLYGNLAPEGALVKTSAVPADQHVWSGPAMVFNSEDEAFVAYNEGRIVAGTGVVIRYEGPKGGPGMKELHRVTEIMKGIPNSAVITDGRFSMARLSLSSRTGISSASTSRRTSSRSRSPRMNLLVESRIGSRSSTRTVVTCSRGTQSRSAPQRRVLCSHNVIN